MATTSLSKFGINVTSAARGIIQPKLKYKYRVKFIGMGVDESSLREYTRNVITADRPKITYAETPVHSYNSIAYMMGKHEWAMVNIVIRDDIDNSVVKAVGDQVQRQVDHHNQTAALAGRDYKFSTKVEILSGAAPDDASVLEHWLMEGCFFQNVDYDAGDYGASEPVQVTLAIRFDNAIHYSSTETGVGSTLMPGGNTTQSSGAADGSLVTSEATLGT